MPTKDLEAIIGKPSIIPGFVIAMPLNNPPSVSADKETRTSSRPDVPAELRELATRAEAGEVVSMMKLGREFEERKENKAAKFWYEAAAAKGITQAKRHIASLLIEEMKWLPAIQLNLIARHEEAHPEYEVTNASILDHWTWEAIDRGIDKLIFPSLTTDPDSLVEVAKFFRFERDEQAAIYLKAAEGDNSEAQCWVGDYYSSKDPQLSEKWLIRAGKQGVLAAQLALAHRFDSEEHGDPDGWWRRVAENGDAWGCVILHQLAERNAARATSRAVRDREFRSAWVWFQRALRCPTINGQPSSAFQLAELRDRFVGFLSKWSVAGEGVRANYALAALYRTGRLVEKDESRAFHHYQLAAEKELASEGSTRALASVGACYLLGIGTEIDESKAREFFLKAASKGNINAKVAHNVLEGRPRKPKFAKFTAELPWWVSLWNNRTGGKEELKEEFSRISPLLKDAVLPSARETPEVFLKTAEELFSSVNSATFLSRDELKNHLQTYLDSVAGRHFDFETNRKWSLLLEGFLFSTALRVECVKPECREPSVLRHVPGGTRGSPTGNFRTEHSGPAGQHGGTLDIPSLKVIFLPFQPRENRVRKNSK